jgi:hypothetical protein
MTVKIWHLLVAGALAIAAATALLTLVADGHGASSGVGTVAVMATALPEDAAKQTAAANVLAALGSVEVFYADHGSYAGATVAALRAIDKTLDPTVRLGLVEGSRYCIESTVAGQTASYTGPGGEIVSGGC